MRKPIAAAVLGVAIAAMAAGPAWAHRAQALWTVSLLDAATVLGPDGLDTSAAGERRKSCGKGRVPVTTNHRRQCRRLRAALPRPRAGDPRLAVVRFALADGAGRLRDRRHHRHPPSLGKLMRRVNRHASGALQAAARRGFARLDRMAVRRARANARTAGAASTKCDSAPTVEEHFTSHGNGEKVEATMTLGSHATLSLGLESGAYAIHLKLTAGDCDRFDAPECPTAAGVVDATDGSRFAVALSVAKDGDVLVSKDLDYTGRTRMHAEVGEDARLTFIDIDDTQTADIDLGGRHQAFGPIRLLYTGVRHTRVAMPAGTYVAGRTLVDIALTAQGVTQGKDALGATAANTADDLDASFATLVEKEIGNFRRLEAGWNTPNRCVRLDFSPAARTLTLRRGGRGSFSAQAVALAGGGASPGHWTRTAQQHATFTPERAEGAQPRFAYTVTDAGTNLTVGAELRATSRAGVGTGSWTQATKDDTEPLYLGQFTGTAAEDQDPDGTSCPSEHAEWSYAASFHDFSSGGPFPIVIRPSTGVEGNGAEAGSESGSGGYVLPACPEIQTPGCATGLERDPARGTGQLIFTVEGDAVEAVVDSFAFRPTTDACGGIGYANGFGGGRFPLSQVGAAVITVHLSEHQDDGFSTRSGGGTLTLRRVN